MVLEYADAMTQTPAEIPDVLFSRLAQNLAPAQLVELTAVIAWENYRARFNHAFGMESENFTAGSYCALPVSSSDNLLRRA